MYIYKESHPLPLCIYKESHPLAFYIYKESHVAQVGELGFRALAGFGGYMDHTLYYYLSGEYPPCPCGLCGNASVTKLNHFSHYEWGGPPSPKPSTRILG